MAKRIGSVRLWTLVGAGLAIVWGFDAGSSLSLGTGISGPADHRVGPGVAAGLQKPKTKDKPTGKQPQPPELPPLPAGPQTLTPGEKHTYPLTLKVGDYTILG